MQDSRCQSCHVAAWEQHGRRSRCCQLPRHRRREFQADGQAWSSVWKVTLPRCGRRTSSHLERVLCSRVPAVPCRAPAVGQLCCGALRGCARGLRLCQLQGPLFTSVLLITHSRLIIAAVSAMAISCAIYACSVS